VYAELEEAKKAFPDAYICILGYDNVRQVQRIMFIAYSPRAGRRPSVPKHIV
jgi:ribulose-bisphosphate carboxylase small chain